MKLRVYLLSILFGLCSCEESFYSVGSIVVNFGSYKCGNEIKINEKPFNNTCTQGSNATSLFTTVTTRVSENINITLSQDGHTYRGSVSLSTDFNNVFINIDENLTVVADEATTPAPEATTAKASTSESPNSTPVATPSATTAAPSVPTLIPVTINYVKFHVETYTTVNKNQSAVSIAVLEFLALIGILALFAYKKVSPARSTPPNDSFQYNTNRNTVQMNDIPQPRSYYNEAVLTPATLPAQTTTAQPQLIAVPSANTSTTTNTSQGGQFADPFQSLDNW